MKAGGVQAAVGQLTVTSPCFKSLGTFGRQHSDGNEVSHPPRTVLRGSERAEYSQYFIISVVSDLL